MRPKRGSPGNVPPPRRASTGTSTIGPSLASAPSTDRELRQARTSVSFPGREQARSRQQDERVDVAVGGDLAHRQRVPGDERDAFERGNPSRESTSTSSPTAAASASRKSHVVAARGP